jgi:hypothetical protein
MNVSGRQSSVIGPVDASVLPAASRKLLVISMYLGDVKETYVSPRLGHKTGKNSLLDTDTLHQEFEQDCVVSHP